MAILNRLKKLANCGCGELSAVKDPQDGLIKTGGADIAIALTRHWQDVFEHRRTDQHLRSDWLSEWSNTQRVPLDSLYPTVEDVLLVLQHLPSSASGPDGIPFVVYSKFKEILASVFLELAHGMLSGSAVPPSDFNYAFLLCLPKGVACYDGGLPFFEAASTRPLSIVDCSNRILASIFLVALERQVSERIVVSQRGSYR